MLAGYDMFDVVSEEWLGRLWKVTIFTAMTGTLPDKVMQSRIHQAALPMAKSRRALAWRIETKLPTLTKLSYSSRSSGESEPSVHLSASASIRPCISASARSRSKASALSRSRHSPTAPGMRSKTALDELVATSRKDRSLTLTRRFRFCLEKAVRSEKGSLLTTITPKEMKALRQSRVSPAKEAGRLTGRSRREFP